MLRVLLWRNCGLIMRIFLRQRGLAQWPREDKRRQSLVDRKCQTVDKVSDWVRVVYCGQGGRDGRSGQSIKSTGSTKSTYPEIAANAALVLIAVANSLLGRQLASQAEAFENEGGFTERLYRVRTNKRNAK